MRSCIDDTTHMLIFVHDKRNHHNGLRSLREENEKMQANKRTFYLDDRQTDNKTRSTVPVDSSSKNLDGQRDTISNGGWKRARFLNVNVCQYF